MPAEVRDALSQRLSIRELLLRATSSEDDDHSLPGLWERLRQSITEIQRTHTLGKPVPGAFSAKIQRRLASTVPPRPTVELDWGDAFAKFNSLCHDGHEATKMLLMGEPLTTSNIVVRCVSPCSSILCKQ